MYARPQGESEIDQLYIIQRVIGPLTMEVCVIRKRLRDLTSCRINPLLKYLVGVRAFHPPQQNDLFMRNPRYVRVPPAAVWPFPVFVTGGVVRSPSGPQVRGAEISGHVAARDAAEKVRRKAHEASAQFHENATLDGSSGKQRVGEN